MEEIDPLLRDLIAELNAAGYETFCSCQGKTSERDFEDERHCAVLQSFAPPNDK